MAQTSKQASHNKTANKQAQKNAPLIYQLHCGRAESRRRINIVNGKILSGGALLLNYYVPYISMINFDSSFLSSSYHKFSLKFIDSELGGRDDNSPRHSLR